MMCYFLSFYILAIGPNKSSNYVDILINDCVTYMIKFEERKGEEDYGGNKISVYHI